MGMYKTFILFSVLVLCYVCLYNMMSLWKSEILLEREIDCCLFCMMKSIVISWKDEY
jgi:hypothetical protein